MMKIEWNRVFITIFILVTVCVIAAVLVWALHNESNRISEGIVIDKDFSSGHSSINGDKNGVHAYSYDDSYRLCLLGNKNDKEVKYWFECTRQEYESYSVGDYFRR